MRQVTVMRGLPGAGKTAYLEALPGVKILSAMDWMRPSPGSPRACNPALLPLASKDCLRRFIQELEAGTPHIGIDNPNLSIVDLAPYAALANLHDYEVEVVTIELSLEEARRRNPPEIPLDALERGIEKLTKGTRDLPPWWRHTMLRAG